MNESEKIIGIGTVEAIWTVDFSDDSGNTVGHLSVSPEGHITFEGDVDVSALQFARAMSELIEKRLVREGSSHPKLAAPPLTLHTATEVSIEAITHELDLYKRAVYELLRGMKPEHAAEEHRHAALTLTYNEPEVGRWHKRVAEALKNLPE